MDAMMKSWIRPKWITLQKLLTPEDLAAAAFRYFGYKPGKSGIISSEKYDASRFVQRMGIDLGDYLDYYIEVGATDAPIGPATPATERLPIRPVLVFRMSRSGRYEAQALSFPAGFRSKDASMAWIDVDDYERELGDDYFTRVLDKSDEADVNE